jgi:hypothetical protein
VPPQTPQRRRQAARCKYSKNTDPGRRATCWRRPLAGPSPMALGAPRPCPVPSQLHVVATVTVDPQRLAILFTTCPARTPVINTEGSCSNKHTALINTQPSSHWLMLALLQARASHRNAARRAPVGAARVCSWKFREMAVEVWRSGGLCGVRRARANTATVFPCARCIFPRAVEWSAGPWRG